MMGFERVVAKQLTDRGVLLTPKHNSIFTAIDENGIDSKLVRTAIAGMINLVTADINRYRNVILPEAKDYEQVVINMTKQDQSGPGDKVVIRIVEHHRGLELFPVTLVPDANVVAAYQELPDVPLIVEWDADTVKENIRSSNVELNDHIQELLHSYSDDHLKSLHEQVFGSLSKNNSLIANLGVDIVGNYDNIVLMLIMTTGYISGTLGVSNLQAPDARGRYLYKLRNVLVTLLSQYEKVYARYITNDILVVRGAINRDGTRDVTLVGENYQRYLEDYSVDAIIGLGLSNDDIRNISFDSMVANIDKYTGVYEASIKVASVNAAFNKIKVLKLAYTVAMRTRLNESTDTQLAGIGITRDSIPKLVNLVSSKIGTLSDEELMDTTTLTREIVGDIIHADPLFMAFIDHIDYYTKMFPKFTVDELVSAATVGIIIDRLETHITRETVDGVNV